MATESKGGTLLKRHRSGKKLTRSQAMLAKCCDCMGYYMDGRFSCSIPDCPMFPWMPYKPKSSHDIETDKMNAELG